MIRQLARENIALLQQGIDLVNSIEDQLYCCQQNLPSISSAGRHLRHVLDFYSAFCCGLERQSAEHPAPRIVDYDLRNRDPQLETVRQRFCDTARELQRKLAQLQESQSLLIVSCEGLSGQQSQVESNTGRELQFLLNHTVHHYAMLAMILRSQGATVPQNFGIAYSTQQYLQDQSSH